MAERVQVILGAEEKERLQQQSAREKTSLSAWIRRAALERLAAISAQHRLSSRAELRAFFSACDRRERGREPDWDEHLQVIERSRRPG